MYVNLLIILLIKPSLPQQIHPKAIPKESCYHWNMKFFKSMKFLIWFTIRWPSSWLYYHGKRRIRPYLPLWPFTPSTHAATIGLLWCNFLRKPRGWPFSFARHSMPSSLNEKFGHLRGACDVGPIQFKTSAQRVNSDGNKKKRKENALQLFALLSISAHIFMEIGRQKSVLFDGSSREKCR